MSITPLPPAPTPLDSPEDFNAKAFTFFAALATFGAEASALAATIDFTSADVQAASACAASAVGTADALGASFVPSIDAWPASGTLILFVRAAYPNATAAPTFTPHPGTVPPKTIVKGAGTALVPGDIPGAGAWLILAYDAASGTVALLNPAMGSKVSSDTVGPAVRQTVLGGPVTSSGQPSFLPATSASLSLTTQNVGTGNSALVVSAANGFAAGGAVDRTGVATGNLTWPALTANATNYLYVDVASNGALTPGSTTLAPLYQQGGARSTTNGQATYNIAEAYMSVGNGSAAQQAYRVFVGEAVTGATSVSSTVAYAYQGRYESGWTATLPTNGAQVVRSANIGVIPRSARVLFQCLAADGGYSVGDVVETFVANAAYAGPSTVGKTRNTVKFNSVSSASPWGSVSASGGQFYPTATSWAYAIFADRGW